MKNMGLSDLALVRPKTFPHAKATARASGAVDVLKNATVVETLAEAIEDADALVDVADDGATRVCGQVSTTQR
jgi:tRNA C32,U32 (ribose-2'-O)-methylase TrmJ